MKLGSWLAGLGGRAGAVIDVSDGLAKDLRRLCAASGVGAELDLRLLRRAVAPGHEELALLLGLDPIALALAGGEDYVLLFTLPDGVAPPARFAATRVGTITAGRRVVYLDAAGRRHPLPCLGWDHLD
jgi:thiamine-monophosphate kinase